MVTGVLIFPNLQYLYAVNKTKLLTYIAIVLIIFSGILFGLIFVVPFLPLSMTQKGIVVTVLVIGMEITWWAGVALVGKQLITRYIKYLNPRTWFSRKNKDIQNGDHRQPDQGKSSDPDYR
jgi:hypothetical protein